MRTETASVGLELMEQSLPQLCAHSKGMCVTVPHFLCDVYVAMSTAVFFGSHTSKNTFKEKKLHHGYSQIRAVMENSFYDMLQLISSEKRETNHIMLTTNKNILFL